MEKINGGGSFVDDATRIKCQISNPSDKNGGGSFVDDATRIKCQISDPSVKNGGKSFVHGATMAMFSSSNPNPGYFAPVSSPNAGAFQRLSGERDILSRFALLEIGSASRATPAFINASATGGFSTSYNSPNTNLPDQSEMYRMRMSEFYGLRMRAPALPQNHQATGQLNYFNVSGGMEKGSFLGRNSNGVPHAYPNVSYPSYGNEAHLNLRPNVSYPCYGSGAHLNLRPNVSYPSYGKETHLNLKPNVSYPSYGSGNCLNVRYPSGYLNNDLRRKPRFARLDSASLARISLLNQRLSVRSSVVIHEIFCEIKDCVPDLMVDQDGNTFIQNFFSICNEHQMDRLLSCVLGDERRLLAICENHLGTRAVQKMLEHLTTPWQKCEALRVLKDHTINLSKGLNSHHVIKQCLIVFSSEETKCVLADNCVKLAMDKNGCHVLQLCAQCTLGEHRDRILAELAANALVLSEHSYGNYVVSLLVNKLRIPHVTAEILSQLKGNYASLSMNKHASNVVEQCLRETQGAQQAQIIIEIMNDQNFLRVLQDPFGNFVAQTALKVSTDGLHRDLVNLIRSLSPCLQSHPHGNRVLAATKGSAQRI